MRDVMAEVGLSPPEDANRLPIGMSAGQRQQVNIARALILEPRLLILDETLSSLDPVEQARLVTFFEGLQARHGLTYLFISHDLAMVRRVCTRIAVMYLGKMVEVADTGGVFYDPGHPYTKALLSAVPTRPASLSHPGRPSRRRAAQSLRSTCRRAAPLPAVAPKRCQFAVLRNRFFGPGCKDGWPPVT